MDELEQRRMLAAPALAAGVLIQDGGHPLQVSGGYSFSAPCAADWTGDGKKDLLVGQFYGGNIWCFPNGGTDAAPAFNGGAMLSAGGATINTSYG